MELLNEREFEEHIRRNYECFIELGTSDISSEFPGKCDICQRDAFLKVHSRTYQQAYYRNDGLPLFVTFFIECPSCRRKSFIKTVQLTNEKPTGKKDEYGDDETITVYQYFKLFRLPTIEESFANKDIPVEYASLKDTVSEASFCLSHSRNIAAAILFRRAIQVLAKDILGASGKTLHLQLEWLKTNKNNLGIDLINVFHDNAKIIKDIGNQGAHPDDDTTLHNFTKEDADGLHDLFISIVHEIFVKPAKLKALQDDLKKSRKLNY
jgi:hypothetical protein